MIEVQQSDRRQETDVVIDEPVEDEYSDYDNKEERRKPEAVMPKKIDKSSVSPGKGAAKSQMSHKSPVPTSK